MFRVRIEEPVDSSAIHELTREAFKNSELGHNGEADLVDAIRAAHVKAISLVAMDQDIVIGHLMSSPACLELSNCVITGTAIGPVSVAPQWRGKRVGTQLITALVSIAKIHGNQFIAVAGHPAYYPRFGFEVISKFGIRHCFKGMREDHFFIRFLAPIDVGATQHGVLKYCIEFGPQDDEEVD